MNTTFRSHKGSVLMWVLLGSCLLTSGAAFAIDLTLSVKTLNPTSISTVGYAVAGVSGDTPGANATAPVDLVLNGLSAGNFTLNSSFGNLPFTIDASGNVTSNDPGTMTASGTTLTIQNTISFPVLTIDGVNSTSINTVGCSLRDNEFDNNTLIGTEQLVAGADLINGVTLPFEGMLADQSFFLITSLGQIRFKLDATGDLLPFNAAAQGKFTFDSISKTMTLQNTIDFPILTINGVNPTSVNSVGFSLRDNEFDNDTSIGTEQLVPGADLPTGVALPFKGMLADQSFLLITSLGQIRFKLDESGDLLPFNAAAQGKFTFDGVTKTMTLQNTVGFPTLTINGVNPTSVNTVGFSLRDNEFSNNTAIGSDQLVPGADLPMGVTLPFEGMLKDQSFLLITSLGQIRFEVDASGNLLPFNAAAQGKFVFDNQTDTMTLQNTLDQQLAVFSEFDSPVASVSIELRENEFNASTGLGVAAVVPGSELDVGTSFPMLGMLADQTFLFLSTFENTRFKLLGDGTADFTVFNSPATQLTPTKGSLAIENGTNTLFLEILPANEAPIVDAGDNFATLSQEQSSTVVSGLATDADGDELTCRWLEGPTVLVGPTILTSAICNLALGNLPALSIGDHTYTLEITDGIAIVTDDVVVTVENSPPVAAPSGGGVFQIGAASDVTLGGQVADYDGESLSFEWRLGGVPLFPVGNITTVFGGDPVNLPDQTVNSLSLGLGTHEIELAVNDGTNAEVAQAITVEIVDTEAPSIELIPSTTILWPPNHKMVEVTIQANVTDNAGGSPTLAVEVESSELPEYDGDGNFQPDHEIVSVDQPSGLIVLNLRSERSGKGDGRTYSVTVTANDTSGNTSTATVEIRAPHSRKP